MRLLETSPLATRKITRKNVRGEAARKGILHRYDFSGVESLGVSRNDAIEQLEKKTHERALEMLKREFGACARFWISPRLGCAAPPLDFYWQKANLGIVITGPPRDDEQDARRNVRPARYRDLSVQGAECWLHQEQGAIKDMKILGAPYYIVWRRPAEFVEKIRRELVASGKYPRLK